MLPENATPAPTEPRRYDRNDPDGRARMAWVLGLPTTAHVCHMPQPRAFKATDPSKASGSGIRYAHRSHKHYSRESEG